MSENPNFKLELAKRAVHRSVVQTSLYRALPSVEDDPGIPVGKITTYKNALLRPIYQTVHLKGREVLTHQLVGVIRTLTDLNPRIERIGHAETLHVVGAYSHMNSEVDESANNPGGDVIRTLDWLWEHYPVIRKKTREEQALALDGMILKSFDWYRDLLFELRARIRLQNGRPGLGLSPGRASRATRRGVGGPG
jgi:hypothetical protein